MEIVPMLRRSAMTAMLAQSTPVWMEIVPIHRRSAMTAMLAQSTPVWMEIVPIFRRSAMTAMLALLIYAMEREIAFIFAIGATMTIPAPSTPAILHGAASIPR
jgi:hypothetical protein